MDLFDIQRAQYCLKETELFDQTVSFTSPISCIVPKIEIEFPGKYDTTNLSFTNPIYPTTDLSEKGTIGLTVTNQTTNDFKELTIDLSIDKGLPSWAFYKIGDYSNSLIVDLSSKKIYIRQQIKPYIFTGEEDYEAADNSTTQVGVPATIIYPNIEDINNDILSNSSVYPFLDCSHFKLDTAGDCINGTPGWDYWGNNQCYFYNYGFDTPETFMNQIKSLYNSSTSKPMQILYYCNEDLNPPLDITNTEFGQELLHNLHERQIAQQFANNSTLFVVQSSIENTIAIASKIKVTYLDHV